jgi:hypothetical protein
MNELGCGDFRLFVFWGGRGCKRFGGAKKSNEEGGRVTDVTSFTF